MTLSEELTWRGFYYQTTFADVTELDSQPRTFYWGVDPSADSMTIGNLAAAMMAKVFIKHGWMPILLVGGATGMIGDPDGKKQERDLKSLEIIAANKQALAEQYNHIFSGAAYNLVDNYDWFKDLNYLDFLRDVGKHVPMRQMLSRDFIQARLGEDSSGISYAEFSYALIQGYDFLHLQREHGATVQLAASDQWGNCIAGVELIRRIDGAEAHIYTMPLMVNKTTGVKFGKSEAGAIWLDAAKTSPYDFYQFWLNCDDAGVEDYLKIYTELGPEAIAQTMESFNTNRGGRAAQRTLANEVTRLIHGEQALSDVLEVTQLLFSGLPLQDDDFSKIGSVFSSILLTSETPLLEALVTLSLASSHTDARRFVQDGAIRLNNEKVTADKQTLAVEDFVGGYVVVRRGKNNVAVARLAD